MTLFNDQKKIQLRLMVSDFHSALFERMTSTRSANKEALRLMEIGLKWEKIDRDPSYPFLAFQSKYAPSPMPAPTGSVESPVAKQAQPAFVAASADYRPLERRTFNNRCEK